MALRISNKNGVAYKVFDSQLESNDIETIKTDDFLSDRVVFFFINYYYLVSFLKHLDQIEIISPEVVQLIKMLEENESIEVIEPLNLHLKELIIMPINDDISAESNGGTHWSLLVYIRTTNAFYHYDSLNNSNYKHAGVVSDKVSKVLKVESEPSMHTCTCTQQQNAIDCGLYVILFAKKIFDIFRESPVIYEDQLESISTEESNRELLLGIIDVVESSSTTLLDE